ncbi:uncharacterized protein DS421_19g666140 [Arachis hypogaea]|uniref:Uncharacterized protein n=1 Tax=Arachis hypogaea TaxID=3818 RepID=A0A6B9VE89_ARAHY|nr:uncharacterized protein DS421_19g666140 [Arachis hypogaea]
MEGATREDTMGTGLEREDANHTIRPEGCRKGSDRREGFRNGPMDTDAHAIASEGDDDDDEPIAKRLHRKHDWTRTPQSCMTEGETGTTSEIDKIENPKFHVSVSGIRHEGGN